MAETLAGTLNKPLEPFDVVGQVSRGSGIRERGELARKALEPTMRGQAEASAEARRLEREGAEKIAQGEVDLARGEVRAIEGAQKAYKEQAGEAPVRNVQDFNPDAAMELAALTAIMGAFVGLSGGGGRGALAALEGVTTGYKEGQQDLYDRQVALYESEIKKYKDNLAQAKQTYDNVIRLETAKKGSGAAELKKLQTQIAGTVGEAQAKAGNFKETGNFLKDAMKALEEVEKGAIEAGFKPAAKPRFAQLKVEGTDREGNKKTLVFNPYDENFDPALMENPTPDTPGFAGFAAERAQTIGSREAGFAGRVQQALSSAATDIKNVINSPGIAEMPVFAGTIGQNPKGVLDSLIALGARGSTPEEQRAFQMLTGGISAALGRIESQGLANGTTVANLKAFDEMKPLAGDSPLVTALYLARLKQELEVGLSVYVTNRATSPEQRAQVRSVVEPILQAINFEPSDVLNAMAKSNAGQGTNLLERARRLINQPVGTVADTPQDLSVKYTIANDPAAIQIRRELQNRTISIETARAQLKALGYE